VRTQVGKGGAILSDIMATTQTSIKISQKGDVVVGTNYRIVTINGYPANVSMAMQRIQDVVLSAASASMMMPLK
jgi:hypothetical protein